LEVKLGVFRQSPALVDHLILLRPADDVRLSGKTQEAWDAAVAAGSSLSMAPVDLETFAKLYAFPRWMQEVSERYSETGVPAEVYEFLANQTGGILELLALPERFSSAAA
jgi:hypothetical protein